MLYSIELALSHARTLEAVSDTPQLDCQLLLAHLLQTRREWLLAHGEHPLAQHEQASFTRLINRRRIGESVAGIIGRKEFWKRSFKVSAATLIPRPATELLVDTLLSRFSQEPLRLVDLGTGAGNIVISLAAERPAWQLFGLEKSLSSLEIARENGKEFAQIAWLAGSWCASLAPESMDIVVSNPPYVRSGDSQTFRRLAFEPAMALKAGVSGLDAIRIIVSQGFDCLKPAGHILIEHGNDQQEEVCQLLQQAGFSEIETFRDLQNINRAVMAIK